MRRSLLLLPLVLGAAPLVQGCAGLIVGGAAGVLISQEYLSGDVLVAHLRSDVDEVWLAAKETMEIYSMDGYEVTETPRRIEGEFDGAKVEVEVQAYDYDHTVVRIDASKYMVGSTETAEDLLAKIVGRLESD
jgi:hypothetical protein